MRRTWFVILMLAALAAPAIAVNPDEMLADPALEARARVISEGLRCLVCQNQSIDNSDADLAHDLRVLVRERLNAGDSDDEATQFIVDRYGEFVLLKPRFELQTLLLWLLSPLVLAGGAIVLYRRSRRRPPPTETSLTAEEQAALDALTTSEEPHA